MLLHHNNHTLDFRLVSRTTVTNLPTGIYMSMSALAQICLSVILSTCLPPSPTGGDIYVHLFDCEVSNLELGKEKPLVRLADARKSLFEAEKSTNPG